MNQQVQYAILFLVIFLLLIGVSHILYRYFNWPSERSRKFLHVSGGILALFCPLVFTSHWWVLSLCVLAFILLLFTYLRHLLPSVHQTTRRSIGSVIFPLPVYICFVTASQLSDTLFFYLPVAFLTISDTLAEYGGKRWGKRSNQLKFNEKTIAGSVTFLVASFVIAVICGELAGLNNHDIILVSICTSLIAMVTEMVSTRGLDNITVPMATLLSLALLKQHVLTGS